MRTVSDRIVNEQASEDQNSAQGTVEKSCNRSAVDLARMVVDNGSQRDEDDDTRKVSTEIFLLEFPLLAERC